MTATGALIGPDFDKAVNILEKKLEGRDGQQRRYSPQRQSSQFNILPKESEDGELIDPSMVATSHLARKASFLLKPSKSGKLGGSGASTASGSNNPSADNPKSSSAPGQQSFPAGAHVPAAYYRYVVIAGYNVQCCT
jgi:hypothetical protein